jgi:hypothetical protein
VPRTFSRSKPTQGRRRAQDWKPGNLGSTPVLPAESLQGSHLNSNSFLSPFREKDGGWVDFSFLGLILKDK